VFKEANSSIQGLRIHTFLKGPKGGVRLTSCNFRLQQQLRHEVDVDFHVLADLCTVVVCSTVGTRRMHSEPILWGHHCIQRS